MESSFSGQSANNIQTAAFTEKGKLGIMYFALVYFENEVSITVDATQKEAMPFCHWPHLKAEFIGLLIGTVYNYIQCKLLFFQIIHQTTPV